MSENTANNNRPDYRSDSKIREKRQALKTLAATGVIAGGVYWARPVVISVSTPAHAQMSDELIMLAGGTSVLRASREPSALENLLDAFPDVIRTAHADSFFDCSCLYFSSNAYCVSVEMDGTGADAMGTITLDGGSLGSCAATFELSGGDTIPQTSLGTACLWISGTFNEDFTEATGYIGSAGSTGTACGGGSWIADVNGLVCNPGASTS